MPRAVLTSAEHHVLIREIRVCCSKDCRGNQIAQNPAALEEEEEDAKEANNCSIWVGALQLSEPDIKSTTLMYVMVRLAQPVEIWRSDRKEMGRE